MTSVADWSTTAASNTSVGGISTDGNVTLVNQIDNMFRGLMAEVATSRDDGTIDKKAPHIVRQQVFTASGTYTPHANMLWCEVEAWGGGGAGGGTPANSATQSSVGAGGHGGAKAYAKLTSSQIGASQAVTIGAGGTGVFGGTGNAGGNTTLGALVNARGGQGGGLVGPLVRSGGAYFVQSTAALQSTVGDILGFTWPGVHGSAGETIILGGRGGADPFAGSSGLGASISSGGSAGGAAAGRAAGGGGAAGAESAGAQTGGAGTAGLLIITEYCSA